MDKVIRIIKKERNNRIITYPFTTFDVVFRSEHPLLKFIGDTFVNPFQCSGQSISELSRSQPMLVPMNKEFNSELVKIVNQIDGVTHSEVQNHFLDNDNATVAIEVPVYYDGKSGLIDIIRLKKGEKHDIIQIIDYKPKAHLEKYAATQVWYYMEAVLSSIITVDNHPCLIKGYYFDQKNCYSITTNVNE